MRRYLNVFIDSDICIHDSKDVYPVAVFFRYKGEDFLLGYDDHMKDILPRPFGDGFAHIYAFPINGIYLKDGTELLKGGRLFLAFLFHRIKVSAIVLAHAYSQQPVYYLKHYRLGYYGVCLKLGIFRYNQIRLTDDFAFYDRY